MRHHLGALRVLTARLEPIFPAYVIAIGLIQ